MRDETREQKDHGGLALATDGLNNAAAECRNTQRQWNVLDEAACVSDV